MSVKARLLLTCARTCAAATALVIVPAVAGPPPPAAAPAVLFGDGDAVVPRRAQPPAAAQAAAPAARPPSPAAAPFVLELPKPAAPAATAGEARPDAIDLGALRFFASQNDLGRVAAEIRLIRAKHPDWEPPPDLFSAGSSGVDEQPLWDLLGRGDVAGLRARMDEIRRDKPDWQPTADLADKLGRREAHDGLVAASEARDWQGVVADAAAAPALLTCADLDALWRTAEALVRLDDRDRAVSAYRYILNTCPAPEARLATVQKAGALLPAEALDGLLALGRRGPDGRGEFDRVRLDPVRRAVGEAAAGGSAPPPTPAEVEALSAAASAPGGAADAELLGWYARSRKDAAGAERWFRLALAAAPSPKAAEGLVLALRDGGKAAEARAEAFARAGLGPLNRKLMVEVAAAGLSDPKLAPPSPDEAAALAAAVEELKSSDGAQALGWSRFKAGDVAGAEGWFRRSMDWQANEAAAIGLVVSASRLHHAADYRARVAQYRTLYSRVAALDAVTRTTPTRSMRVAVQAAPQAASRAPHAAGGPVRLARAERAAAGGSSGGAWDKDASDIVHTYEQGQYDTALAMMQRRGGKAQPRGLSVVRAWALYHKGDWEGAKQAFSSLDAGQWSPERVEGLRVIQNGYTNPHLR